MQKLAKLLMRIIVTVIVVSLITAAAYWISGGRTKVGLSDWLVYASFFTLTAGTLMGIFRVGYRGNLEEEAASAGMGVFERSLKEFFQAGPFGVMVTLAGLVCFLVGVLVDVLF